MLLGWQISGKGGMLNATGRERRGLVTEYKIKFLTRSGDWACINNSRTGKEVSSIVLLSITFIFWYIHYLLYEPRRKEIQRIFILLYFKIQRKILGLSRYIKSSNEKFHLIPVVC